MKKTKKSANPFRDRWFLDYKCEDGSTSHMEAPREAVQNQAVLYMLEYNQHARQVVIGPINPITRWDRTMEIIKQVGENQTEKTMPEDFDDLSKPKG